MTRIGLIADTHDYLDEAIFHHFKDCDEIWHAGDFGNIEIVEKLRAFRPLRGVWGNIDGPAIRSEFPETLRFQCEETEVLMTHIGGYPGKYVASVKQEMLQAPPKLFISGHSHILKVMYDEKFACLHMNPGAAGKQGWHKMRTVIRFAIDGNKPQQCEVIELGRK
jgi:putative phosphoesterase